VVRRLRTPRHALIDVLAAQVGELAKYAQRIMFWLNPDGESRDQERAASAASCWATRNSTADSTA